MSENEAEYVKLISSDGFEFVIHREAAIRSGTIKNMLCGPGLYTTEKTRERETTAVNMLFQVQFRESVDNEITFRDIK